MWRELIHRMIAKHGQKKRNVKNIKNEQKKRKQTCSLCFVNMFKFQENKFKIIQKNFLEIKIVLIKKRFLGKATGHNDHHINMGGQRPKIGGNRPLTGVTLDNV